MTPRETDKLEQLLGDLPAVRPTPRDVQRVRDGIANGDSISAKASVNGDQKCARRPLWQRRVTIPQALAACLVVCVGSVLVTVMLVSSPQIQDKTSGQRESPARRPVAPPVSRVGPRLVIQTDFFTRRQPEPTPRPIGIRQWTAGGSQ